MYDSIVHHLDWPELYQALSYTKLSALPSRVSLSDIDRYVWLYPGIYLDITINHDHTLSYMYLSDSIYIQ